MTPAALFILSLPAATPILTSSSGLVETRVNTADFQYFGPRDETVSGAAVYPTTDRELCDPHEDEVRGRIVFWQSNVVMSCTFEELYLRLNAAGAAALVKPTWARVPGFTCLGFNFMRAQTQRGQMTVVESYEKDLDLELWKTQPLLEFTVSPPHDDAYRRLFMSMGWTVSLRIVIPILGFWTSACAFAASAATLAMTVKVKY